MAPIPAGGYKNQETSQQSRSCQDLEMAVWKGRLWSFWKAIRGAGRWLKWPIWDLGNPAQFWHAEEALEQMPANLNIAEHSLDTKGVQVTERRTVSEEELESWKGQLRREITELRGELQTQSIDHSKTLEDWMTLFRDNPGTLASKLQSLPGEVVHWNLARSASSPPLSWRTACGWSFYGSNFTFVEPEADLTCHAMR